MGYGTAWGGHLSCKEENRRVRFPYAPPLPRLAAYMRDYVNWSDGDPYKIEVIGSSPMFRTIQGCNSVARVTGFSLDLKDY